MSDKHDYDTMEELINAIALATSISIKRKELCTECFYHALVIRLIQQAYDSDQISDSTILSLTKDLMAGIGYDQIVEEVDTSKMH